MPGDIGLPPAIAQIIQDRAQANGVDPTLLARIAKIESNGNPNARASTSSAGGLFQITGPTWGQYGNGGDVLDPRANADAAARITADRTKALQAAGYEATPENVYLAHFAGSGGANAVLGADPGTPVAGLLGPAAIRSNPFLANMTAGDLQNWASWKISGAGSAPTGVAQVPPEADQSGNPTVGLGQTQPTDQSSPNTGKLAQLAQQWAQQDQLQPMQTQPLNYYKPNPLRIAQFASRGGVG